jgi:GTP-binding protein HflX
VDAFKATLEELKYADLIIHVIDASNPLWQQQARVVDDLIAQLGADGTPRVEAFNKCDLNPADIHPHGENIVEISAKTGQGSDALLALVEKHLGRISRRVTLRLPYEKSRVLDELYGEGVVAEARYLDDCIEVDAALSPESRGRLRQFLPEEPAP